MQAVILVNAAPGFESSVISALKKLDGVAGLTRIKKENFDMAVLIDVEDSQEMQRFLTSELMFISGVQGAERVENPSDALMARLTRSA